MTKFFKQAEKICLNKQMKDIFYKLVWKKDQGFMPPWLVSVLSFYLKPEILSCLELQCTWYSFWKMLSDMHICMLRHSQYSL